MKLVAMLSKNLGEVASGRQFAAEGLHLFAQASRFRLERLSFRFQIAYLVRAQCSQGLPDRRVLGAESLVLCPVLVMFRFEQLVSA